MNDDDHFLDWFEFDEDWTLDALVRVSLFALQAWIRRQLKKVARRKGKPLSKQESPERTQKEDK